MADLAAVMRLQWAAGLSADAGALRAAVVDDDRLVVVAAVDGEVVGWAKTHRYRVADGAARAGHYLGGVTVHPRWRRHGIGTLLTTARMEWLAVRTDRVHYLVNARNGESIALHRRWGFVEVARARSFHGVTFAGGSGVLLSVRPGAPRVPPAPGDEVSAAGSPRSSG
ncbi:acetyltransferase (GNAT) family protein [Isoptericola jiangsuensis]|uniref:Acetyltransferase (GNAT) family protein n=1 Tax=Isoptericola jiangsuensis TaxID=548579 RepID=A0A2A9EUI8_9MICO|nr:GNAT family N-acetyltransferase [Isoptericola jiangsuensis]PFG42236.1 acetyltransferase (GNAT) family protein [Isoptericola jiangsuensis]